MSSSNQDPFSQVPKPNLLGDWERLNIEKATQQSDSSKTTAYLPIVNGQRVVTDTPPMGDWLGFCSVFLHRGNYGGDFWTTTDPDDHLAATSRKDVKFGRVVKTKGTGAWKEDCFQSTILYTSGEKDSKIPYRVIDKKQIKNRVVQWIEVKAKVARYGDTVTIILICHGGASSGGFRLGEQFLMPDEFAQAIKAFKPDVQVNTVYNGCYSAYFHDAITQTHEKKERRFVHVAAGKDENAVADRKSPSGRYHQTPFTRIWIQSMMGVTLDRGRHIFKSPTGRSIGFPDERDLTIKRHRERVLEATTMRSNPADVSHSEMFISDQHLTESNLLSKVLFRKYVDIAYDPLLNSQRMRLECNTARVMRKAASKQLHPSQETVHNAKYLCEREHEAFDAQPMPSDMGLWSANSSPEWRERNLPSLLLNLYWRTRMQMAIFAVFCQLYEQDMVSAQALATPILYTRVPENVRNVMQILECFTKMADLSMPPSLDAKWDLNDFDAATFWFSVMICRSCEDVEDLNKLVSLVEYSKCLGRLDKAAVTNINEKHNRAAQKALATSSKYKGNGKGKEREVEVAPLFEGNEMQNAADKVTHQVFGLMLPAGSGSNIRQLFDDANTKFTEIEKVFKAFFDMTDDELALVDGD
ncbi:MAG: hypothetical protein Q9213_000780 [Squamulea squamosa]